VLPLPNHNASRLCFIVLLIMNVSHSHFSYNHHPNAMHMFPCCHPLWWVTVELSKFDFIYFSSRTSKVEFLMLASLIDTTLKVYEALLELNMTSLKNLMTWIFTYFDALWVVLAFLFSGIILQCYMFEPHEWCKCCEYWSKKVENTFGSSYQMLSPSKLRRTEHN
jgi:hypothetical protein